VALTCPCSALTVPAGCLLAAVFYIKTLCAHHHEHVHVECLKLSSPVALWNTTLLLLVLLWLVMLLVYRLSAVITCLLLLLLLLQALLSTC